MMIAWRIAPLQTGTLRSPEFPAGNRSFRNGRDNRIMPAAMAATHAISRKNSACEKLDHRPPSQPAKKFPAKLVESQIPITVERELPGAMPAISDRPIGEKLSSAMVSTTKYNNSQSQLEPSAPLIHAA